MPSKILIYKGTMIKSVALARFSTLLFTLLGPPLTFAYNEYIYRSNASLPIPTDSAAYYWQSIIRPRLILLASKFGVSDSDDKNGNGNGKVLRKHASADPKSMRDVYVRTGLSTSPLLSSSLCLI